MDKILENIKKASEKKPYDVEIYHDWLSWNINEDSLEEQKKLRHAISEAMKTAPNKGELGELWRKSLLYDARYDFDSYCLYLELERDKGTKFYAPRRKQLLPVVNELQRLADGDISLLCISLPPGVGKTTLAEFFVTFCAGREPGKGILCGSHSASFLDGLYEEFTRILDKDGEYLWQEIFPGHPIINRAKQQKIDVDRAKKFSTIQFASAGSGMAGKVRAQQLLYCDDLIPNIEEAMSKDRLDKKWQQYTTDYRQRKQSEECAELHIATRWSVNDVIGRLEELYGESPKSSFISVPALNEEGQSNFDYGGSIGFSTKFYEDMQVTMDEVSWRALYMNEPIEREGLLYTKEELNRYYELPEGEPDAVLAVCDTAEGGGDDTVLPVFAVYGNNHYLIDCVCTDALPEVTDTLCAEILYKNGVQSVQFESNSAGGRTADKVEELVKKKCQETGRRNTHVTKKRTTANKATKIIVNSSWVKENCYFLDDQKIQKGSPYYMFMRKMCAYSLKGKNKHDDVVDALAQYALFVDGLVGAKAQVMRRMF